MRAPRPLAALALLVACGSGVDDPPDPDSEADSEADTSADSDPDSSPDPDSDSTPGNGPVALRELGRGFSQPVAVVARPGTADLYVVERTGRIRPIGPDGSPGPTFLDLVESVTSRGSEQGLLGLAFPPDHAETGRLYVHFTRPNGDSVLARFTVGADPSAVDPASRENLWIVDQPYSNHNAGHLAFGPDGMLYVPWGDGGSRDDPLGAGQDPSTPLGSMHRLDVSPATGFVAPADNPFVGQEDIPATTWAIGLRNPWKFSFDRQTGDLWIADVGQDRWEEINRQPASSTGGENYGWNVMEGAHCRAGACDPSGFVAPVHEYGHDAGCSITGGVVYRGAIAALAGHYLFSDFCRGGLRSVPVTAEGVGAEVDWGPIVDPAGTTLLAVSTFGETAAGEVVVASLQTGRIHLLVAE